MIIKFGRLYNLLFVQLVQRFVVRDYPASARVGGVKTYLGCGAIGLSRECAGWWSASCCDFTKVWIIPRVRGLVARAIANTCNLPDYPACARVGGFTLYERWARNRLSRVCAGWWTSKKSRNNSPQFIPRMRGLTVVEGMEFSSASVYPACSRVDGPVIK